MDIRKLVHAYIKYLSGFKHRSSPKHACLVAIHVKYFILELKANADQKRKFMTYLLKEVCLVLSEVPDLGDLMTHKTSYIE